MMREIKFRAFDTDRKMFVPQGEIVFSDYGDTRISVVPNCMEYVGDKCHNGEPQRERFIVDQYTGLKDKNGVEIYEGDIIETETGKPMPVVWNSKFASFCLYRDDWAFAHWFGESTDPQQCIVLGNIHQHGSLLKTS